ncbi:iron-sulfur cluster repair protein YtfE (RIC family) [Actinopolymorpha rutila]|uniref:Iron-sulfur cluster repair protein YtfE (RIC family) n=2 Tax=Actinopolymorpha rutila TaxID=446787 RepID=A0A852ZH47_9ACTN|nr:iron-sulfur cluster repair protein YtfE (RIC family) [Actinopolymorpha rutila]
MSGTLGRQVGSLIAAAAEGDTKASNDARDDLLEWCETELLPHAQAEEATLYPTAHARSDARLLVDGMLAEHRLILGLVREVGAAEGVVQVAAEARALQAAFDSHLTKENEQLVPLLESAPDFSLAEMLDGMHEILGQDR